MRGTLRRTTALLLSGIFFIGGIEDAVPATIQPKQTYKRKSAVPVELNIFIPLDHVDNPQDVGATIFEGDSPRAVRDTASYRCRQKVTVIPAQSLSADGLKAGTIENLVGVTRQYDPPTSLDASGYLTAAARADMTIGAPMMVNFDVASTADMHVTVTRLSSRRVKVVLQGAAANPLVPLAPAIDWDITVEIDSTDKARPKYTVTGSHDGFPSYELLLFGQPIYSYAPADPGSSTAPLALFPPMDITASSSGDIQ